MKKFKVIFEASFMTKIPNTFVDNEMWIEFECENIDVAEETAFRAICYELIETQHNVLRKIELIEIQEVEEEEIIQRREYHDE